MTKKLLYWIVVLSPILLVFLFHEDIVTGSDPANFSMALRYGFDLAAYRPHPPGYPLLVLLWNIPYQLLPISPHTALLIVNTVFMVLAVAAIGKTYKLFWGDHGKLMAMVLLATSPLFIYYGNTGEMYVYDAAFSLIVVNTFYTVSRKQLPLYALLLGLAGGIRQSSLIFLLPLVVLLLWYRRKQIELTIRLILLSTMGLSIGILLWFIPLILSVGGLDNFMELFVEAIDVQATILQNILTVGSVALWVLIPSFLLYRIPNKKSAGIKQHILPLAIWILPALLFFIFRHYSKGYLLLIAPAYLVAISRWIVVQYPKYWIRVMAICSILQVLIFLFVPVIQMPYQSTMAKQHRTFAERLTSSAIRLISVIGPTNAHLRASEEEVHEILRMFLPLPDNTIILIDPSIDASINRVLQVPLPNLRYTRLSLDDTSRIGLWTGKENCISYKAHAIFTGDSIYLLCNKGWMPHYKERLGITPISIGTYVVLFKLTPNEIDPIRQFLVELYLPKNN